jgi:3-dehydroquinate synthase
MFDLSINLPGEASQVLVESRVRDRIGQVLAEIVSPGRVCLVTDSRVGPLYADPLEASLGSAGFDVVGHTVPEGEASKSLDEAGRLYESLARQELGRDGLLVALGGGVVSDLTGFVAATWLRGVDFAICPTTLEADVDAAIGGKTGINLPAGKNLVGSFHQPRLIAVDPDCLATLDPRDVRAGLAESVKHGLVFSEAFLGWHEENVDAILGLDAEVIRSLILRNIRIKAGVVESDARERTGRRILLNFGHTIGHAVERCAGYRYRHGECVALGMMAACRLSAARGLLDAAAVERVERLLASLGLPCALRDPPPLDDILGCIRKDKKAVSARVRFVLLEGVGRPVVCDDVSDEEIRAAYDSLIEG